MSNIQISIVDDEINQRLEAILGQLENPRGLMSAVAEALHRHTMQTFENEGDPANSWAPLKKTTLRNRKANGYGAGPILQRSERLKRSVMASSGLDYAMLSTNAPQAAAHHFGAVIKRQGYIRLRTKNKSGELQRNKEYSNLAVFAKNSHKRAVTRAVNYVINIPARPILPIDENNELTPSAKNTIFDVVNQLILKTS